MVFNTLCHLASLLVRVRQFLINISYHSQKFIIWLRLLQPTSADSASNNSFGLFYKSKNRSQPCKFPLRSLCRAFTPSSRC